MNKICSSYVTFEECSHFPNTKLIHRCIGTKDCDECTCGGDEAECDFYPEKREKAMAERKIYTEPEEIKLSFDEIKEAIDKHIAKKPLIKVLNINNLPYRYVCCPSCEQQLIAHESYCRYCGQHIQWDLDE